MFVIALSTVAWQCPPHQPGAGAPTARTPVMIVPQRQISDHFTVFRKDLGKKVEAATSNHLAEGWQQMQADASGGWKQLQAKLEGFERALADASFSAKSAKAKAARAKAEAEQAEATAAAARAAQARGLLSARAEQAEATAAAAREAFTTAAVATAATAAVAAAKNPFHHLILDSFKC